MAYELSKGAGQMTKRQIGGSKISKWLDFCSPSGLYLVLDAYQMIGT